MAACSTFTSTANLLEDTICSMNSKNSLQYIASFGDPGGIRTHGLSLRRRSLYPTELRVHALIYKEFSDFFESFTEPILLTSANTFPSTHGYRRFFGPGPMLANLPEKINFRTDSCSGQESFSLLRLPSAVLLGGNRSILLSYGTMSRKPFIFKAFRILRTFVFWVLLAISVSWVTVLLAGG